MSKQELIEINPFNKEIIEMVIKYDKENNTNYCKNLKTIQDTIGDTKEYEIYRMIKPVIDGVFAYHNTNNLSNLCSVHQEKDLKKFIMELDDKNFEIYRDLENYAFKNLGMKDVIALVEKNNNKLINMLLADEFIPLFDDNSKEKLVPLIKDSEEIIKKIR